MVVVSCLLVSGGSFVLVGLGFRKVMGGGGSGICWV